MKKVGFTLAEVLITLMILGVIAALTIPTLVKETRKQEEIAQIKKGMSILNQALDMNYALDKKTLSDLGAQEDPDAAVRNMLQKRLAVTKMDDYQPLVETQDGLGYFIHHPTSCKKGEVYNTDGTMNWENQCADDVYIITTPHPVDDWNNGTSNFPNPATVGNLTGCYQFIATHNGIVPTKETQEILSAENPDEPSSN